MSRYQCVYLDRYKVEIGWDQDCQGYFSCISDLSVSGGQLLTTFGEKSDIYQDVNSLIADMSVECQRLGIDDFSVPEISLASLEEAQNIHYLSRDDETIVDLGISDAEYLQALEQGIDLRAKHDALEYLERIVCHVPEFYRRLPETKAKEHTDTLIRSALTEIGKHEDIVNDDGSVDLEGVDHWIKKHFGMPLTDFPSAILSGYNPITGNILENHR